MSGGKKPRAMIAMSGGVDSSVAALLTKAAGYECVGLTMKLFPDTQDIASAKLAADKLGIEHRAVDFSSEFQERVIEPFIAAYESGETPNPCVTCNSEIKFGRLIEYAKAEGFDRLITGHYAGIYTGPDGACRLKRAKDATKDQTYFLFRLTPDKLRHLLFPLGGLTKKEVRAMAEEAGLPVFDKSESQDICFIPDGDHADFIAARRGTPPAIGDFVDTAGRVLGRHGGIERYTIGQRKGLGVALGRPVFVKEIRKDSGQVVLAGEEEVFASRIELSDVNMQAEEATLPMRVQVMIRYNAKPAWATVRPGPDESLIVEFDEPVRAPAKGQSAVMYDGDLVIGGGRIVAAGMNKRL